MGMKHTLTDIERETRLLRMLYVEDNEDARTATLLVLNEFFSDITIATNGQAGLAACEV
jgi:CheY-like chemotaxis protein